MIKDKTEREHRLSAAQTRLVRPIVESKIRAEHLDEMDGEELDINELNDHFDRQFARLFDK